MSQRKQAEYERLFLTASQLEGRERNAFLDDACRNDPKLRQAVELLLQPAQVSEPAEELFRSETIGWRRSVRRHVITSIQKLTSLLRFPTGPLLALVTLIVIGVWTNDAMREGIENVIGKGLDAHHASCRQNLIFWEREKERGASYFASLPELASLVRELQAIEEEPAGAGLLDSPAQEGIRELLEPLHTELDDEGFWLLDHSGRCIAAERDESIGARLSLRGSALLAGVFAGEPEMIGPVAREEVLAVEGLSVPGIIVIVAAPIRSAGATLGALLLRVDPSVDFNEIFTIELGRLADTFAFDRDGVLLSDTIWKGELQKLGLLPSGPEVTAALKVQIRDPGGNLTGGFTTETPVTARPLTRMAASAVAGESGFSFDSYRNFLGVEVVGAWRWLPEFDLGIATEICVVPGNSLLRPLKLAFWVMLGLLIGAVTLVLLSSYSVATLSRGLEAQQLGQYTLVEKLGEGGMGAVFKARHAMLRRMTAVKILKPEVIDAESIARFEREVQLTSQLAHPNTVEIYDYGRDKKGVFYYAMEYIDGITLSELLEKEGALPPSRAVFILEQVCGSLREAHARGLVHRDVKPLNIMLSRRGGLCDVVKVLDFGLVKDVTPGGDVRLTAPQIVKGTPLYIAPERVLDPSTVDARSDIYSLGAVAFNLLTGVELFEGRSPTELLNKVLNSTPRRPSSCGAGEIPAELDQLVFDCLAKCPEDRPGHVEAVLEILESTSLPPWTQEQARAWWEVHAGAQADRAAAPGDDGETADLECPR